MLYLLIITDTEISEDFEIGIFETQKQAKDIAEYYLKKVKGFCDYSCTYRIVPMLIENCSESTEHRKLWIVTGYNTNENLDETDIIKSSLFTSEEQAVQELNRMKEKYTRTEWITDCMTVGKLHWQEGFIRV